MVKVLKFMGANLWVQTDGFLSFPQEGNRPFANLIFWLYHNRHVCLENKKLYQFPVFFK